MCTASSTILQELILPYDLLNCEKGAAVVFFGFDRKCRMAPL